VEIDFAAFKDIESDVDFCNKLLSEQMVLVLPGKAFRAPGFVRIVFCAPERILSKACDRIQAFCSAHYKK